MEVRRSVRQLGFLAAALGVLLLASPAQARVNGLATTGCDSCHKGGRPTMVGISMDPLLLQPGGTAVVTIKIQPSNGGGVGFYIHARGQGSFSEVPGQGVRFPTNAEAVHASPKRGGDPVTFQVKWTAPPMKGAYDFEVSAVASNGNNDPGGDTMGTAKLSFTVGCDGIDVWVDVDGDGYGSDMIPPSKACEVVPGTASKAGDCNDFRAFVHPGAPEVCNEYDDNCNGMMNEGLESTTLYKDADGDGHGGRFSTDMQVGCKAGTGGWSPLRDDCDDNDKDIYPGAKEVCNTKDDNCNGRVDEGARVTCGMGWCRAQADSCATSMCIPGIPKPEECNLVDDNCDGMIDNGARCEAGRVCVLGRCLAPDDATAIGEAMRAGDGGVSTGPGNPDGGAGSPPPGRTPDDRKRATGCAYGAGELGVVWILLCSFALALALRRRSR